MTSSDSSSDSNIGYSNFKKYKKRQLKNVRKANPPAAAQPEKPATKPFQSKLLKNTKNDDSDGSASDKEMTVEQLIAERKKNKSKQEEKPFEIELLDDTFEDNAVVEDKDTKNKKKKELLPSPPKKSKAILDEICSLEREVLLADQAHSAVVRHIANQIQGPIVDLADDDDTISVILEVLHDKDFHLNFKMKYDERFESVFLDQASKAGYDRPESIKILWDSEDAYVNVKYFDTPEKLKMPNGGVVKLIISPKEGAVREQRSEGEIKIKLNMKTEKNPLERLIHKEMPFGEFKVKLCSELKIAPSKIRFTFDGETVGDDSTPNDYDMEDFDIVDLHVQA